MVRRPARLVALGFGSGLSPIAPGTAGTLWAWLSFVVLDRWLGDLAWAVLIAAGIAYGIHACAQVAAEIGDTDPGSIVWDEIVAFWLVLWISRGDVAAQLGAFVLFRFFDMVKPPPVRTVERRFAGGFGIVVDDLVAAGLSLLVIAGWRAWA